MQSNSLIGTTFGRLVVLREVDPIVYSSTRQRRYSCQCSCGSTKVVRRPDLVSGRTKSCGCLLKETTRKRGLANLVHGHRRPLATTNTYWSYSNMIQRCTNPNRFDYKYYGGRGISVCRRWLEEGGFEAFLADMGEAPKGLTLERVEVDGDYKPSNCMWASREQQAKNRRNVVTKK